MHAAQGKMQQPPATFYAPNIVSCTPVLDSIYIVIRTYNIT